MKYIKNGKIILPDSEVSGKVLVFSSEVIDIIDESEIGAYGFGDVVDANNGIVSPGLIDLHIHGYKGNDASDGDEKGLAEMAKDLVANGVTAFLPTTMTVEEKQLDKAFDVIRKLSKQSRGGAEILGVNAEGPFINPSKKGAQKAENIKTPDADQGV